MRAPPLLLLLALEVVLGPGRTVWGGDPPSSESRRGVNRGDERDYERGSFAKSLQKINPWMSACDIVFETRDALENRGGADEEDVVARSLCDDDNYQRRIARLDDAFLSTCRERKLLDALDEMGRHQAFQGGRPCYLTLIELLRVDALAKAAVEDLSRVLLRYDCGQTFSVHSCSDCKEAYRRWVCSSLVPLFMSGAGLRKGRWKSSGSSGSGGSGEGDVVPEGVASSRGAAPDVGTSPSRAQNSARRARAATPTDSYRRHTNPNNNYNKRINNNNNKINNNYINNNKYMNNYNVKAEEDGHERLPSNVYDEDEYENEWVSGSVIGGGDGDVRTGAPLYTSDNYVSNNTTFYDMYEVWSVRNDNATHSKTRDTRPEQKMVEARKGLDNRLGNASRSRRSGPEADADTESNRFFRLKPCLSVCQAVEQTCPYFQPADRAPSYPMQYAGEPTFLCLDPNIKEVGEQLLKSNYGSADCCYHHCGKNGDSLCHSCTVLPQHEQPPAPSCNGPSPSPTTSESSASVATASSSVIIIFIASLPILNSYSYTLH